MFNIYLCIYLRLHVRKLPSLIPHLDLLAEEQLLMSNVFGASGDQKHPNLDPLDASDKFAD